MAFRLFTTFYNEPNPARRLELELALALNWQQGAEVSVVAELVASPPRGFRGSWLNIGERQTFSDLLAMAQDVADDDLVVIANCDIVVPRWSLDRMAECLADGEAWCLTRWEVAGQYALSVWDVGYSQDVWAFRGPPRDSIRGDYYFGVPGCDNHFSWELREAGYRLHNPSKTIPTWHLHASRRRTATNSERFRVPPPYLYVTPTTLGAEQELVEALTLEARRTAFRNRRLTRR